MIPHRKTEDTSAERKVGTLRQYPKCERHPHNEKRRCRECRTGYCEHDKRKDACEKCKQAKLDLQTAMLQRERAAQEHRHGQPPQPPKEKNKLEQYAERLLDRAFEEYTDLYVSGRASTRDLAINHVAARCDANLNTTFDSVANEKYGAVAPTTPLECVVRGMQAEKERLFCANDELQRKVRDMEQTVGDLRRDNETMRSQLAREERRRTRRRARGIESDSDSSDSSGRSKRSTTAVVVVNTIGDDSVAETQRAMATAMAAIQAQNSNCAKK
jgi:hypothetical protein